MPDYLWFGVGIQFGNDLLWPGCIMQELADQHEGRGIMQALFAISLN